ncbi:P-loop containing nucleoside triphosphate hydrolase protein, partial [Gongronella butleri]
VRSNLDPFGEHDDVDLFDVLHRVYLIAATPTDGHILSQGQRQLVCMAREVLRRNKIVIMDEATSSVDVETDRKIQNTIATEFTHCTILCIAHRLRTIADYVRVLVLDKGSIVD